MQRRHEDTVMAAAAVAATVIALGCAVHALRALHADDGSGEQQALLSVLVLLLGPGAVLGWCLHVQARRHLERRAFLREALTSADPEARAAAARELGSGVGFSDDLIALTDDPEPFVRRELAEGLATRGTEAVSLLTALLADGDSSVRLAAARSLREIVVRREALLPPDLGRFPELEAALVYAAADPDRETRGDVVAVLRALGREAESEGSGGLPPAPLRDPAVVAERPERRIGRVAALGFGLMLSGVVCSQAARWNPRGPWRELAILLFGLGVLQLVLLTVLGAWLQRRHRVAPELSGPKEP